MPDAAIIASRDNQKLKYARKVRDGKSTDAVFIEGVRQCEEALRAHLKVNECFFEESFAAHERGAEILKKISNSQTFAAQVDAKIFHTIADTKNSQGIILIAEKPKTDKETFEKKLALKPIDLVVFLSEVNNPSNLGAIMRTAEAAGISGLIVSSNSADAFSPKATRSALGANLRLPIWENTDFAPIISWARNMNLMTTAADINGSEIYTEIDWKIPRMLVFGSEARGLSAEEKSQVDQLILVPMKNGVESLNLAVSSGIILFEANRQKKVF